MLALIQRVSHAAVAIDGQKIAAIGVGVLAFIGIEKIDTREVAEKLFMRVMNYRIFPDSADKMNLSLIDVQGGLLLVPQFTLLAETNKGTRPGFSLGMDPENGAKLFEYLVEFAENNFSRVKAGRFGANMQVSLCNDGPVTFILDTKKSIR